MFTCFIRYHLDLKNLDSFKEYAQVWIALIQKYGGIHHGYFIPDERGNFPDAKFSFPGLGIEGPSNIAVALFSFPSVEAYEKYRKDVPNDEECKRITEKFKENKCFLKYERNFLSPIFN